MLPYYQNQIILNSTFWVTPTCQVWLRILKDFIILSVFLTTIPHHLYSDPKPPFQFLFAHGDPWIQLCSVSSHMPVLLHLPVSLSHYLCQNRSFSGSKSSAQGDFFVPLSTVWLEHLLSMRFIGTYNLLSHLIRFIEILQLKRIDELKTTPFIQYLW